MLNALEVAVTLPAAACKVSPVPAALMERFGNVAVPVASVVWVSVPPRVPGPDSVRLMETPGSTAAELSVARTWTGGVIV
jgi:hypothetical protein